MCVNYNAYPYKPFFNNTQYKIYNLPLEYDSDCFSKDKPNNYC